MRSLTHSIYIVAIIAASITTYFITSSVNQPEVDQGNPQSLNSDRTAAKEAANNTTPKPQTETIKQNAPINDESESMALAEAQAKISALETELAEYQQQLQSQLKQTIQSLSPQLAEAKRAAGRDYQWATATELDLETIFIRDERLRDINIDELACYTEHCELTLSHSNLMDGFPTQYFNSLLNEEERFQANNFNIMTIGGTETTQLILNKGETISD